MKKGQGKLPWPSCRIASESDSLALPSLKLKKLVKGEMTECLQGMISALKAENRYLDGELIRVTCKLYIHRDLNLTAYSEDNRGLKEELAKLKEVEKENNEVLEQQQQLAKLQTLNSNMEFSPKRANEAEAKWRDRIEKLEKGASKFNTMFVLGAKAGF